MLAETLAAYVSIVDFGAKGDGVTDNKPAIEAAARYAKAIGGTLYVPPGTFNHSGMITFDGIAVRGAGPTAILKAVGASNTYDKQALVLTGNGPSLRYLTLDSDATQRRSSGDSAKVWVRGARNFLVEGLNIRNSMSAGILMTGGASYGTVRGNHVTSTNADGIHMSQASHHITVTGNKVESAADDGIAVVSYMKNGSMVNNITIVNNTVLNNTWGRNIAVVGGTAVTIQKNLMEGNLADRAGLYIASEWAYDTFGVSNVLATDNVIKRTGGYDAGQGAVSLINTTGRTITGITLRHNEILNSEKQAIFLRGKPIANITIDATLISGFGGKAIELLDSPTNVKITNTSYSAAGWTPVTGAGAPPLDLGSPLDAALVNPAPSPLGTRITVLANSDSWQGDPAFRLFVDGKQVGGDTYVNMPRRNGWKAFDFHVPLSAPPATFSLQYFNDRNGGSPTTDRNIYVDNILVDGKAIPRSQLRMMINGTYHVSVTAHGSLFRKAWLDSLGLTWVARVDPVVPGLLTRG